MLKYGFIYTYTDPNHTPPLFRAQIQLSKLAIPQIALLQEITHNASHPVHRVSV